MKPRKYIYLLFFLFGSIFFIYSYYIYNFSQKYPLPITDNIFFDAKIKFIKDNIDIKRVDTLIIGSSIGVNNLSGKILQGHSQRVKYILNLSIHGAYTKRSEQLYTLIDIFPNLKRVIYSTQYTDMGVTHKYKKFNPELIKLYLKNKLSLYEEIKLLFKSCNNILFCINREKIWTKEYQQKDKFTSLVFDSSGSVGLEIDKNNTDKGRWSGAQPGYMPEVSYEAIGKMANIAYLKGVKFYLIQNPYRKKIIERDKRVKNSMSEFALKVKYIVNSNGGIYINLHKQLNLSDNSFADRSHLNRIGSRKTAIFIAKFIDNYENNISK